MYEIYLTNAVVLLTVGAITTVYVLYNATVNRVRKYVWLQTLEALATIAIGVFYLYCSLVLNKDAKLSMTDVQFNIITETILNTTNNNITDEVFTLQNDKHNNNSENYLYSHDTQGTEPTKIKPTEVQNNETLHSQFIFKYQHLLDKITKHKNKTVMNNDIKQTNNSNKVSGIFINNVRLPARNQRNAFLQIENDSFYKMFLKYAMFVCSFIQGVLYLINSSVDCKMCQNEDKQNETFEKNESEHPTQDKNKQIETFEEKENMHPFADTWENTETTIDFKVFMAPSELRKDNIKSQAKVEEILDDPAENETDNISVEKPQNCKHVTLCFMSNLLVPILCVVGLYYSIMDTSVINKDYQSSVIADHDFMKINSNILDLLENPPNVSNMNKINEVGNIISNIYKIIAEQNMTQEVQTPFPPPVMYNILYNLNRDIRKKSSSKQHENNNVALKIYMFMIVILGYFITVFSTKVTQLQLVENDITRNFKQNIWSFAVLWFPAIIEIFARMYITDSKPNVVSDLFTLVGNINHLLINLRNILISKELVKNNNVIKPKV